MDEMDRPPRKRQRPKSTLPEGNPVDHRATSSFGGVNSGIQTGQNNGNITTNFYSQADISEVAENRKCLRALYATNPRLDKDRIESAKGGLLEDAYRWVLENADFKRWCYENESQLLWIKGDPGKGKTMLLCGVINELIEASPASETTVIFFFCQATDDRINHSTAVLRGLIFMLIDQHPSLVSHVRHEYDKAGDKIFQDANAWQVLLGILTSIFQDPLLQKTYLIIDALDECTTGLSQLLDLIVAKSSSYSHVKWLISSRNWPSIEQTLETATRKGKLWLELNEASVSKAVASFIHSKVQTLAKKKKYTDEIRDFVSQHLIANAHGTFLWVALVCQELAKMEVSRRAARAKLKEFPAGLDQLYRRMLDQISSTEDAELCKYILGISTTVYRPITLEELGSFINFPTDFELSDLEEIIGLCGSFLTLRGSTISLVHQSANDFLHRQAAQEIFPCEEETVHHRIFSKSLAAMRGTLRRDIYNLVHPGYPIGRVQQPEPDPLAAVRYACLYWVSHLQVSSHRTCADAIDDFQEDGPVNEFLRLNYLNWLEAMSLMRALSKGIESILQLKSLIKLAKQIVLGQSEIGNVNLIDRAHDASRFSLYHQAAIKNFPLQVYASALIFSPAKSITRIQYQVQEPDWIVNHPDMGDEWSPCLQTLEGHSDHVSSVCFSHDSRFIASASRDCTVKIWDTSSGQCLTTLNGHTKQIYSLCLSHDSKILASASADSTIRIWDRSSGQCIMTLQNYDCCSRSITFFQFSKFLASGLDNGSIEIWNTGNGTCLRTLEGPAKEIRKVVLSHDFQLLASASLDQAIQIWNMNSGTWLQTLLDQKNQVTSVAFSHDSQLLASIDSGGLKIWKRGSGSGSWQCLQNFGRHGTQSSVIFSHDSKVLASDSDQSSIKLRETSSGRCLQTFEGHQDNVLSVVFSHDSKLLASASADNTIRIWDATDRQQPNMFYTDRGGADLYFSHDSRLLASVGTFVPFYILVWDAYSGKCIQKIKNVKGRAVSLMFSHDLKFFVARSVDRTVRLWDIDSRQCMQTFKERGIDLRTFFLHNPDLNLFDSSVRLSSFFVDGPNWRTHDARSRSEGYGISEDLRYITWNSECLLWLPPEYRPDSKFRPVVSDSTICISCTSGRVFFFTFDSAALSDVLVAI